MFIYFWRLVGDGMDMVLLGLMQTKYLVVRSTHSILSIGAKISRGQVY